MYAKVNHFMLLHMHESNEAETDKRGEMVQMRRLQGRCKKTKEKRKTSKMEQKQSKATEIQALPPTPA